MTPLEIDHTREELYKVVKEPKPGFDYAADAFHLDAAMEQVETNFFADAEDDI